MAKRSPIKGTGAKVKTVKAAAPVSKGKGTFGLVHERLLGWLLLLVVVLAYSPVWWAGYVWDDVTHVTENPCIIGPLGLKEIWTTHAASICPLTLTTFWLEHALWGLAPLPYHLLTVFLHALCAVVLWRLLRSLQIPGAWLGAALWAVHPLQVESVAWITEMKNTQSGLFYLLSILFFVKWLRARESDQSGGWNYALTLLFALLAIASKFSTVVLPVVLCLCAWWVEGRWHWRNLVRLAPIFVMSAIAGAVTLWLGTQAPVMLGAQPERSWPERIAAAGDVIWFYVGKLLWPHPLMTIYPRWQIDAGQLFSYMPLLVAIIIIFILWLKRDTWSRPCFFALAYFLVTLFPFLGLLDQSFWRYSFVEDHLQYLAAMGPLALAGAGLVRLADSLIPGRQGRQSILGAGVLLTLGTLSWQRAWAYESEEIFWTDALAKNPDCWLAYNNLGSVFLQNGQVNKATVQFQKAVDMNPNYAESHYNLGLAFSQKGLVDDAMAQDQKALELYPDYVEAHTSLGWDLLQKGQSNQATIEFQKALALNPSYAKAAYNLGATLLQKGEVDAAIAQFQKLLEYDPNLASAHYNLGIALLQGGRTDEATAQFQEALRLKPDFSEAQKKLFETQATLRKPIQK